MEIQVKVHPVSPDFVPERKTADSAGFDLKAYIEEPLELKPGARALVSTGITLEIPPGYEGQVRPRSGLAIKYGITLLNTPGTIDADYRGEVRVIIYNAGDNSYFLSPGERIAQIVIKKSEDVRFVISDTLTETARGAGGFGSTG